MHTKSHAVWLSVGQAAVQHSPARGSQPEAAATGRLSVLGGTARVGTGRVGSGRVGSSRVEWGRGSGWWV